MNYSYMNYSFLPIYPGYKITINTIFDEKHTKIIDAPQETLLNNI